METVQWKDSYSVGNQLIDSQHKRLIGMLNKMIQNEDLEFNSELLSNVLSEMIEYAGTHFDSEEAYMRQIEYPGMESHRHLHRKFKLKASQFCLDAMANKNLVLEEILKFLADWWINHILNSDMKYKTFQKTKSIAS